MEEQKNLLGNSKFVIYRWLDDTNKKDPNDFSGMIPHFDKVNQNLSFVLLLNYSVQREMLHFDCTFESGNIDRVVRKGKYEYDIYPRTDANTRGHNYWFYFSVKTPWHPDRIKKYK